MNRPFDAPYPDDYAAPHVFSTLLTREIVSAEMLTICDSSNPYNLRVSRVFQFYQYQSVVIRELAHSCKFLLAVFSYVESARAELGQFLPEHYYRLGTTPLLRARLPQERLHAP